jgi:hypothetical protein
VQVDPIKPTLKPPGTKRLKLTYDEPVSNFAFKFSLRRYNEAPEESAAAAAAALEALLPALLVGQCSLTLSKPC